MDSATLEQENLEVDHGAEAETATGPRCEKCEQPLASELATACPHCGWYASIGAYVEIEPQWEAAVAGGGAPAEQKTFLEVWTGIIPAWVWINWACGTTAIVLSIVARVAIQDEAFRSTWSVTQLFAGMGLALACHIAVFVMMAMDDPDLGLGDIVVSPLKGWRKLFAQMPRRQVVACMFNFAMSAAVGAMMIIGGIPYERVLEWGIKEPPKKNLLNAIASTAPAGGGDMSMEEAMDSFAADAAVQGGAGPKKGPARPVSKNLKRKKIDALILGYQLDRNQTIKTFFLATEVNGRLLYAGRVTPSFTPDESLELAEQLRAARSLRPVVTAPDEGIWLQPRFTCRVTYDKRVESGRLQGLLWEEMLGEIKLPW